MGGGDLVSSSLYHSMTRLDHYSVMNTINVM